MKLLKMNLSNENLIVNNNKMFPSMIMNKFMNTIFCVCCMFVMACCCCVISIVDMMCKMVNEKLKYVKYKTTVLFMKYFMRNFMDITVVFSV